MKTKTITYQRVLNLGDYNSKRLEEVIEIDEGDNAEQETSHLMERVERKIREDTAAKIEDEIDQLQKQLRDLKRKHEAVKAASRLPQESPTSMLLIIEEDPDPDNIPFETGSSTANDDPSKYF